MRLPAGIVKGPVTLFCSVCGNYFETEGGSEGSVPCLRCGNAVQLPAVPKTPVTLTCSICGNEFKTTLEGNSKGSVQCFRCSGIVEFEVEAA